MTTLAQRISRWPAASIEACKRAVYAAADLSLAESWREAAYPLYQALSQTPAQKRCQHADETGAQFAMNNQRHWQTLPPALQEVQ